ncbi:MAG TPA: hypothetical protein VNZ03_34810 [Terriglobales bacterium]|nr:hypothetical protein [Terriglobales bacterium]
MSRIWILFGASTLWVPVVAAAAANWLIDPLVWICQTLLEKVSADLLVRASDELDPEHLAKFVTTWYQLATKAASSSRKWSAAFQSAARRKSVLDEKNVVSEKMRRAQKACEV